MCIRDRSQCCFNVFVYLDPGSFHKLSCNDEYLVLKIRHLLVKENLWFWFRKLSKVIVKIRFVRLFSPLKGENEKNRKRNQIELVWKVKSLRAFVYHKLYTKKYANDLWLNSTFAPIYLVCFRVYLSLISPETKMRPKFCKSWWWINAIKRTTTRLHE